MHMYIQTYLYMQMYMTPPPTKKKKLGVGDEWCRKIGSLGGCGFSLNYGEGQGIFWMCQNCMKMKGFPNISKNCIKTKKIGFLWRWEDFEFCGGGMGSFFYFSGLWGRGDSSPSPSPTLRKILRDDKMRGEEN